MAISIARGDGTRDGVVNDVRRLDALIVRLEPGVDPERLDADDLLLLVGHRAGDVHNVDDGGDGLRLRTSGLIGSIIGAIVVTAAYRWYRARGRTA